MSHPLYPDKRLLIRIHTMDCLLLQKICVRMRGGIAIALSSWTIMLNLPRKIGYVETISGRKRHLSFNDNPQRTTRQVLSTLVQGSAADLVLYNIDHAPLVLTLTAEIGSDTDR